jgi:hypothetical protein
MSKCKYRVLSTEYNVKDERKSAVAVIGSAAAIVAIKEMQSTECRVKVKDKGRLSWSSAAARL